MKTTIDKTTANKMIVNNPANYIVTMYDEKGNLEIGVTLGENDGISDSEKKVKLDSFIAKYFVGSGKQMFFGKEENEVYRYIFQIN